MFAKIKGGLKAFFKGQRYYHIRYILKYVLLWLALCLIITNIYGRQYFEDEREECEKTITQYIEKTLSVLRETARTQDLTTDENRVLIKYTMQQLDAYAVMVSHGSVRTGTAYWSSQKDMHTDADDNAYLVIWGDNGKRVYEIPLESGEVIHYYDGSDRDTLIKENVNKYYYCPRKYFEDVWNETIGSKKNVDSAWWTTSNRPGWRFELIDGYISGTEFRPGTIHAMYYENGAITEEKTIQCNFIGNGKKFEQVTFSEKNELLIPKDIEEWQTESYDEQLDARYPIYGNNRIIYPLYYVYRDSFYEYEIPVVVHSYLLATKYVLFGRDIDIPFNYCSGDFAYIYREYFTDVNGNECDIAIRFTEEGLLAGCNRNVFKHLLIHYIVLGILLGTIAFVRYRRMFSLRTASRFHKSLINSMAHDLKTPLMIMQGFGENLAENVHTEKREYYAAQILDNVRYLNGLIDKNLDLAKKEDVSFTRESMFIMHPVEEAENRYQELLQQKNLTISKDGDMLVHGDKALLQTVIDNLILNAIKYSPEGGEILVCAGNRRFSISNTASLSYAKNINKLLEPLEMGEESRTSGKGTGLGLSIANSITEQHGWKMKLSYDKKQSVFTCTIKIPRWRQ